MLPNQACTCSPPRPAFLRRSWTPINDRTMRSTRASLRSGDSAVASTTIARATSTDTRSRSSPISGLPLLRPPTIAATHTKCRAVRFGAIYTIFYATVWRRAAQQAGEVSCVSHEGYTLHDSSLLERQSCVQQGLVMCHPNEHMMLANCPRRDPAAQETNHCNIWSVWVNTS
jgi:hypothetical protein